MSEKSQEREKAKRRHSGGSTEIKAGGDRSVFIAVPTYDGMNTADQTRNLINEVVLLIQAGYSVTYSFIAGIPYLPVVRNKMVGEFMLSGHSDMIFLDSDVSFDPGGMVQLLSYDVDLVMGAYRLKRDEEAYPVKLLKDSEGLTINHPTLPLLSVDYGPTGFMRIRRGVFQEFEKKFTRKNLQVVEKDWEGNVLAKYLAFFDTEQKPDQWVGEDIRFCRQWNEMGGTSWVDPTLKLKHMGRKIWAGDYAGYLERQTASSESDTSSAA